MSNGTRRHFTPQQKAEVVRRHLVGKEAVSDLASELQIQPSQAVGDQSRYPPPRIRPIGRSVTAIPVAERFINGDWTNQHLDHKRRKGLRTARGMMPSLPHDPSCHPSTWGCGL